MRFQNQVLRAFPKEEVFAQMVAGFEIASADPRVVAVNLVQSQDEYRALHDFDLHMRMLDYLHGVYPHVHISLARRRTHARRSETRRTVGVAHSRVH